jgi:lysophospholipase L1-like esterase
VTSWVSLVSCLALLAGGASGPRQTGDPTRFEPEIRKYEEADRTAPPRPGGVLFTGSSSIRLWETLAADFPGLTTINRGFGGSEIEDAIAHVDRLVLRHKPSQVVFYSGDNDLAGGKTPAMVAADYKRFVAAVHRRLPATRVVIIAIKPSPARWSIVDKARETNRLVQEMVRRDRKRLAFVDVFTPMLGRDGKPRPELYVADGLHMTRAGYAIWKAAVAPVLENAALPASAKELPEAE